MSDGNGGTSGWQLLFSVLTPIAATVTLAVVLLFGKSLYALDRFTAAERKEMWSEMRDLRQDVSILATKFEESMKRIDRMEAERDGGK